MIRVVHIALRMLLLAGPLLWCCESWAQTGIDQPPPSSVPTVQTSPEAPLSTVPVTVSESLLVGAWEALSTVSSGQSVRIRMVLKADGTGLAGYQVIDEADSIQVIIEWEWLRQDEEGVAWFRWRAPDWDFWREWAVVFPDTNRMINLATPGVVLQRTE